jgi:hypothetical protein
VRLFESTRIFAISQPASPYSHEASTLPPPVRTRYYDHCGKIHSSRETPNLNGLFTYVVLLNVERKDSPASIPPQVAFDLAVAPRAVCLHLEGGYLGHSITSNVVQVSTGTIVEAVARFRNSRGDNSSNNRFERARGSIFGETGSG